MAPRRSGRLPQGSEDSIDEDVIRAHRMLGAPGIGGAPGWPLKGALLCNAKYFTIRSSREARLATILETAR